MSLLVVGLVGLLLGLLVGRWWLLAGPLALGVWAAGVSELEVPSWYIGLIYGLAGAAGVTGGVLLRRVARRDARRS